MKQIRSHYSNVDRLNEKAKKTKEIPSNIVEPERALDRNSLLKLRSRYGAS